VSFLSSSSSWLEDYNLLFCYKFCQFYTGKKIKKRDWVEFVLREVVKEENEEGEKQTYTPEEEGEIKKRLKSLGYL